MKTVHASTPPNLLFMQKQLRAHVQPMRLGFILINDNGRNLSGDGILFVKDTDWSSGRIDRAATNLAQRTIVGPAILWIKKANVE